MFQLAPLHQVYPTGDDRGEMDVRCDGELSISVGPMKIRLDEDLRHASVSQGAEPVQLRLQWVELWALNEPK